jgi:hypothetical protein
MRHNRFAGRPFRLELSSKAKLQSKTLTDPIKKPAIDQAKPESKAPRREVASAFRIFAFLIFAASGWEPVFPF